MTAMCSVSIVISSQHNTELHEWDGFQAIAWGCWVDLVWGPGDDWLLNASHLVNGHGWHALYRKTVHPQYVGHCSLALVNGSRNTAAKSKCITLQSLEPEAGVCTST